MLDNDFFSVEDLICNDNFSSRLCGNCPAIHCTPAILEDPADYDCPASFQPWDVDCIKHDKFEIIEEAIKACNAVIASALKN